MKDSENGGLSRADEIRLADEALLADLGYKQEFKRAFTPLEVCRPVMQYVRALLT